MMIFSTRWQHKIQQDIIDLIQREEWDYCDTILNAHLVLFVQNNISGTDQSVNVLFQHLF